MNTRHVHERTLLALKVLLLAVSSMAWTARPLTSTASLVISGN